MLILPITIDHPMRDKNSLRWISEQYFGVVVVVVVISLPLLTI